MTTQITVRLPDENVAWLDAEVAAGRFPSRTAGLARLLSKAQRRQEDEADMLKILANPDPDEESRLEWMRTRDYPPMDDALGYGNAERAAESAPDGAAAVREWAAKNGITTSVNAPKAATKTRRTPRTGTFVKATKAAGTKIST